MSKTGRKIEKDIFHIFKDSDFGKAITGTTYRKGVRPRDAKTEDAVVAFQAGTGNQTQRGIVYIDVYVPNIPVQGRKDLCPTIARIDELETLAVRMVKECTSVEYDLQLDSTPDDAEVEGVDQQCIYIRISFKRTTIND